MTEKKTAEEFMELYLAHELEKSYSDINANIELIEEMMEAYAAQQKSEIKMPTEEEIEAAEIIQHLKAYGMIHPITAVKYSEGTHEDFIKRADEWIWRFRSRLTCSEKPNNSQKTEGGAK